MGTLFNQDVRRRCNVDVQTIINMIDDIKSVSKKTGFSHDQCIQVWKIAEMSRQNDLFVNNGDIHDEQMMGFGEVLRDGFAELVNAISND